MGVRHQLLISLEIFRGTSFGIRAQDRDWLIIHLAEQKCDLSPQRDGFRILHKRGVRCFHDYMRERDMWQTKFDDILQMELEYSTNENFIPLAKYIHVIAEKQWFEP